MKRSCEEVLVGDVLIGEEIIFLPLYRWMSPLPIGKMHCGKWNQNNYALLETSSINKNKY